MGKEELGALFKINLWVTAAYNDKPRAAVFLWLGRSCQAQRRTDGLSSLLGKAFCGKGRATVPGLRLSLRKGTGKETAQSRAGKHLVT